jgi:hypothetical protein
MINIILYLQSHFFRNILENIKSKLFENCRNKSKRKDNNKNLVFLLIILTFLSDLE